MMTPATSLGNVIGQRHPTGDIIRHIIQPVGSTAGTASVP